MQIKILSSNLFSNIKKIKEPVYFGTNFGIIGAVFVSFGHVTPANLIWSISNLCLLYHNYRIGQKAQAKMFLIYALLGINGVFRHFLFGQ